MQRERVTKSETTTKKQEYDKPTLQKINVENVDLQPKNEDDLESSNPHNDEDNNNVYDVIIVGAGWAGLAAANRLESKKLSNYLILEGRDYIGGRSRTLTLQDGITRAEYGSQWVHGTSKKNPAYQVLLESGIEHYCSDGEGENDQVYYESDESSDEDSESESESESAAESDSESESDSVSDSDSISKKRLEQHHSRRKKSSSSAQPVPEQEVDRMFQKFFRGPKGFFRYQSRRQDEGSHDKSLRTVLNDYCKKVQPTLREFRWIEYIMESAITQEYSASMEDLSLWYWDSDAENPGRDCYVACGGGFSDIIEKYYATPTIQSKIRLNCNVSAIDYSNDPVGLEFTETTTKTTEGGASKKQKEAKKQIQARHVILTVPLGVLKANIISFVPELPNNKKDAIDKLGFGLLNKIIMLWDERDADQLPWSKKEDAWIQKIAGGMNRKQGYFTEFYSPPTTSTDKEKTSENGVLLYGFLAGSIAKNAEETLSNAQIERECLQSLRSLFGEIPEPKQVIISRWGQDEFSYGSYSYHKVHSTPNHRKILASTLRNRLHFAGEATDTKHFATIHGAMESGTRAANKVCKSSNVCPPTLKSPFGYIKQKAKRDRVKIAKKKKGNDSRSSFPLHYQNNKREKKN